jgi:hypothetical protein
MSMVELLAAMAEHVGSGLPAFAIGGALRHVLHLFSPATHYS